MPENKMTVSELLAKARACRDKEKLKAHAREIGKRGGRPKEGKEAIK